MTAITVAPFTAERLEECTHLYVSVFNGSPWHDQWTFETAHKRLSDIMATPGFVGFLTTDPESGNVTGLVMGNNEQWYDGTFFFYIKEMCVGAELQRQGVGGKLLAALEEHLGPSVSLIYLLTGAGGQTENFYTKNRFRASTEMIMMSRRPG